jgi:hypothetical protein
MASLGWPADTTGDWESLRAVPGGRRERGMKIAMQESASVRRIEPPMEFPALANCTVADAHAYRDAQRPSPGSELTLRQIAGDWLSPEGSWTW